MQALNAGDASEGSEFAGGASICELRTLAGRNLGLGHMYGFDSTGAWRDLIVPDYDKLTKTLALFRVTTSELSDNTDVFACALVALAHLIAWGKRSCEVPDVPDTWHDELAKRRNELGEFVRKHFWDAERDQPNAASLASAARRALGPWAVKRTFAVLVESLQAYTDVVRRLKNNLAENGLLFNGPFFIHVP